MERSARDHFKHSKLALVLLGVVSSSCGGPNAQSPSSSQAQTQSADSMEQQAEALLSNGSQDREAAQSAAQSRRSEEAVAEPARPTARCNSIREREFLIDCEKMRVVLAEPLRFQIDRATFTPRSLALLTRVSDALLRSTQMAVRVRTFDPGNHQNRGLRLSRRRSRSLATFFDHRGVEAEACSADTRFGSALPMIHLRMELVARDGQSEPEPHQCAPEPLWECESAAFFTRSVGRGGHELAQGHHIDCLNHRLVLSGRRAEQGQALAQALVDHPQLRVRVKGWPRAALSELGLPVDRVVQCDEDADRDYELIAPGEALECETP